METMRVNNTFVLAGVRMTQAELIALLLVLAGVILVLEVSRG